MSSYRIPFRNFLPVLVVAVVLGTASLADAAFSMRLSTTSGFSLTITDGGVGDSSAEAGMIVYVGSAGANFALTVDTGLSKPLIGSAASPHMDLSFIATSTGSANDALTIEIGDRGFTSSPLTMIADIGGALSGNMSSVRFETSFDNGNALFGVADGLTSQTFTTSPFSGSQTLSVSGAAPYSLTERVIITSSRGGMGIASGNAELSPVPAPAALVLTLTGIPFLGVGAWCRRRRGGFRPLPTAA